MNNVVVGIGDCQVSKDANSVLVTYALGSCIGVMIHDPVTGVGGLLHFMLPESSLDPSKAERNPYMFADTGIPMLFRSAYQLGADKKRLVVTVAGGAQMMDTQGTFNLSGRYGVANSSFGGWQRNGDAAGVRASGTRNATHGFRNEEGNLNGFYGFDCGRFACHAFVREARSGNVGI